MVRIQHGFFREAEKLIQNAVKQGAGISAIVLRVAKTAVKDGVTHKSGVSSSAVVGNYK